MIYAKMRNRTLMHIYTTSSLFSQNNSAFLIADISLSIMDNIILKLVSILEDINVPNNNLDQI
jgi:hypothetical protein